MAGSHDSHAESSSPHPPGTLRKATSSFNEIMIHMYVRNNMTRKEKMERSTFVNDNIRGVSRSRTPTRALPGSGGHHHLFSSRTVFLVPLLACMTTAATDDHSLPYCTVNYDVECDPKLYTATAYASLKVTNAISSSDDDNKYKVSLTFLWDEEVDDILYVGTESIEHVLTKSHTYGTDGTYYTGSSVTFDEGSTGCDDASFDFHFDAWFEDGSCGFREIDGDGSDVSASSMSPMDDESETNVDNDVEEVAEVEEKEEVEDEEEVASKEENDDNVTVNISPSIITSGKCDYEYEIDCTTNGYSTTASVLFSVGENTAGSMQKYDATVTFFGGLGQEQTIIDTYRRGNEVRLSKTFDHDDAGTYIVGYQLSFGKGTGCEDRGFTQLYKLTYDVKKNTCSLPYYEGEASELAEVDSNVEEEEEAAAEEADVEVEVKEEGEGEEEEESIHTLPPTSSLPIITSGKCDYEYDIVCTTDGYSTTATVLFSVGENTLGSKQKYDATVTFFGGMDQGHIITDTYIRGEQYKLAKTFGHGDMETTYIVGYSLVYGEGAGCEENGFTQLYELTYDVETKTCSLPYYEGEYIPVSDVASERSVEPDSSLMSSVNSNATLVNNGPYKTLIISATLALASCGIIFALGMYYTVGKKKKRLTAQCLAMREMKFVEAGSESSPETKPNVESSIMHSAGDGYFGTILIRKQNATIDDLSTLGDPMHTVGTASDRNVRKTSSILISQRQLNITDQLERGIGELSTANQSCKSPMMVSMGTSLDVGVVDINNLDLITVVAPKGKLGIMLDSPNPNGGLPVVYAVSESSVLRDKVCIGDLLLAVDEVDCEGLSAHDVASILSSRRHNAIRALVLARRRSDRSEV